METGQHWLGRYKNLFRELGRRPTTRERKDRTAERHRLVIPTRIAMAVAEVVLASFLIVPMVRTIAGS